MYEDISRTSELLDDELRQQIGGVLEKLEKKLTIRTVVKRDDKKSMELLSLLFDMQDVKPAFELEILETGEERERYEDFDPEGKFPVMGMYLDGVYTGVSFYGVPGGREMNSFVLGCYNIAGKGQAVGAFVEKRLPKVKKPHSIQVFVSLACHHCAATVISAQHLAALSGNISAAMIDANLFPEYIEKYKIERVPLTVIDGKKKLLGEKTMDDLLEAL